MPRRQKDGTTPSRVRVYVIAEAGDWRLIEAIRRTDIGTTVLDPGQRAMVPKSAVRPRAAVQ